MELNRASQLWLANKGAGQVSMAMDETQIIQNCQNGKLDDFALIYDVYVEKIFNYIFRRIFHRQTSEDLTSLTFMKALEKIGTFKTQEGSFQSWLFQIARNNLIDHYRKTTVSVDLEKARDIQSPHDVAGEIFSKLEMERLEKALKELPQLQQEVVTLRIWEDLSHREIAQTLGISEANSKMTFSRAVHQLKNL